MKNKKKGKYDEIVFVEEFSYGELAGRFADILRRRKNLHDKKIKKTIEEFPVTLKTQSPTK